MKLTELHESAGESLAASEKALGEANARAEKLAMGVEDTTGRLAARERRSPSWRSENVSRRQTWRRYKRKWLIMPPSSKPARRSRPRSKPKQALEGRLQQLEMMNLDLAQQRGDTASEVAALSAKLKASSVAQDVAMAEADRLRSEVAATRVTCTEEAERRAELETQMSQAEQMKDDAVQRATALEARCDELASTLSKCEAHLNEAETTTSRLLDDKSAHQSALDDAESRLLEMSERARKSDAEVDSLRQFWRGTKRNRSGSHL